MHINRSTAVEVAAAAAATTSLWNEISSARRRNNSSLQYDVFMNVYLISGNSYLPWKENKEKRSITKSRFSPVGFLFVLFDVINWLSVHKQTHVNHKYPIQSTNIGLFYYSEIKHIRNAFHTISDNLKHGTGKIATLLLIDYYNDLFIIHFGMIYCHAGMP